jgi:hypothetical protein
MSNDEREWIVEPPGPGKVKLHFACGEGVELTAEQEDALAELLRTLEAGDAEVAGFAGSAGVRCPSLECFRLEPACAALCRAYVKKVAQESAAGSTWSLMGTFGVEQR